MATQRQSHQGKKRTRIMVDVTPDLRRRVKIAAAEQDVSVRDYVVQILEQALADGRSPRTDRGNPVTAEAVERLAATRDLILQGRTFTDDSADLIRQAREERDAELDRASGR